MALCPRSMIVGNWKGLPLEQQNYLQLEVTDGLVQALTMFLSLTKRSICIIGSSLTNTYYIQFEIKKSTREKTLLNLATL